MTKHDAPADDFALVAQLWAAANDAKAERIADLELVVDTHRAVGDAQGQRLDELEQENSELRRELAELRGQLARLQQPRQRGGLQRISSAA
jgi:TolA-binding protein